MFVLLPLLLLTSCYALPENGASESLYMDHIKGFMFLVENHAFHMGQIYFMGTLLDDEKSEALATFIRELLKWNATMHKVSVVRAERSSMVEYDTFYRTCRVLKLEHVDDNVKNYRSVANIRTNPYIIHAIYALLPIPRITSPFWYRCENFITWEINVIKLDRRVSH